MEPLFTGRDLELLEALVYDPALEPGYEILKDCLVWDDEVPDGLTPAGHETLGDLLVARSRVQRGRPLAPDPLAGDHYRVVWERALGQRFSWPGFRRLVLAPELLELYARWSTCTDEI